MKRVFKLLITSLATTIAINMHAQQDNLVTAKIETKNVEGSVDMKAIVQNNGEIHQSLNYIFLAVKKDKNKNMSSSQQQNKFTLLPKETKVLSEISMNVGKENALKAFLFIKDEKTQKVIAKDSLEVNAKSIKNGISYEKTTNEENMMMKGVIIDDTKSRVGGEFYSRFYSLLMLNNLKFNFRIKISELPSTGRNTILQIFADDDNILSFNAKPDDDYLDDAVRETLAGLVKYVSNKNVSDQGFLY